MDQIRLDECIEILELHLAGSSRGHHNRCPVDIPDSSYRPLCPTFLHVTVIDVSAGSPCRVQGDALAQECDSALKVKTNIGAVYGSLLFGPPSTLAIQNAFLFLARAKSQNEGISVVIVVIIQSFDPSKNPPTDKTAWEGTSREKET
jgi:hypothetical protein